MATMASGSGNVHHGDYIHQLTSSLVGRNDVIVA